jgi:pimeloyl-ACP methyl ester carboxylesterase
MKSIKLSGFTLLLTTFLLACTTSPKRWPAQDQDLPRHVVILVHGIGGNKSHFGNMEEALRQHLNSLDTRFRYDVINFEYDTANETKTIFDFALSLDEFIKTNTAASDKISFVAHSQGGLIATAWVLNAADQVADYQASAKVSDVISFTTLATPYWGAKISKIGNIVKILTNEYKVPFKVGRQQLKDMSFGSNFIYWLRNKLSRPNLFESDIRLQNIGGYVKWLKFLPGKLGSQVFEDDVAVILPSSNFDFYHLQSFKNGYVTNDRVEAEEFAATHAATFNVINGIHLSPLVNKKQISRGLAQIPTECAQNLDCDHPAFKRVVENILGQPLGWKADESAQMTSFLIDLNINFPEEVKAKDVKVFADAPQGVSVARDSEFMSHGNIGVKGSNVVRVYLTGVVKSDAGKELKTETVVPLRVYAKGYKQRIIKAKVKAMTSTFIEMNLEK